MYLSDMQSAVFITRIKKHHFTYVLGITLALLAFLLPLILYSSGEAQELQAKSYYVSPYGKDENLGTLQKPFRTVQRCADIVTAGAICYLRKGIYRETITPANSGQVKARITFKSYQNEQVTISGAEPLINWQKLDEKDKILSWKKYRNKLYKSKMSWDLGPGENQLFIDGKMLIEARWPNTDSSDISKPRNALSQKAVCGQIDGSDYGKQCSQSGKTYQGYFFDSDLDQPVNWWKGAQINVALGPVWYFQTGTVKSSEPGRIEFDFTLLDKIFIPQAKNPYFLWGKKELLDAETEWFYDKETSDLIIWPPHNKKLPNSVVEAKKREYAFNLSGKSYISVESINFFSTSILTDSSTSNILLKNIGAKYLSHHTTENISTHLSKSGILMMGNNNEIKDCKLSYSSGNGITLIGNENLIQNNIISDVNYTGGDYAAISLTNIAAPVSLTSSSNQITHNTFYRSARSMLLFYPEGGHNKVTYNNFYQAGLQLADFGLFYTTSFKEKNEIAYNLFHDIKEKNYGNHPGAAIYLDFTSSGFNIHHNLVWDVPRGIQLNISSKTWEKSKFPYIYPIKDIRVYNNTVVSQKSLVNDFLPQTSDLDRVSIDNNIFRGEITKGNLLAALGNNNMYNGVDPRFVNPKLANFQLKAESPAINAGKNLPPFTAGFVGSKPDIGAFESGRSSWKAGASNLSSI
jgi:hypothetical protein